MIQVGEANFPVIQVIINREGGCLNLCPMFFFLIPQLPLS